MSHIQNELKLSKTGKELRIVFFTQELRDKERAKVENGEKDMEARSSWRVSPLKFVSTGSCGKCWWVKKNKLIGIYWDIHQL